MGEQKLIHFAEVLTAGGQFAQAQEVLGSMNRNSRRRAGSGTAGRADLLVAKKQWRRPPGAGGTAETGSAKREGAARPWPDLLPARTTSAATLAFEAACQIPESAYRADLELANIRAQEPPLREEHRLP